MMRSPSPPPKTYADALRQSDREAAVTLAAALAIALLFALCAVFLPDLDLCLEGLPLWAWAAFAGGWILCVAFVTAAVRFLYRNFPLSWPDDDP